MNYQLKSMGATLDNVCKPAGQCTCCPDELTPGDWYYDPESPNVIHCQPQPNSQAIEAIPCNEDDVYTNTASGIVYRFSANSGMYAIGFAAANTTYIILGEISGAITVPENCTLIFQGGKFTGSLTGNYTTIEAGPVQIFDVGLELSGTFTNEYAYPEWWGAVAYSQKPYKQNDNDILFDCSSAINAALVSPFGVIHFCPGYYYISESIVLTKVKTIVMQGGGLTYSTPPETPPVPSTVICTDQDIDAFVINITQQDGNWRQRLDITGGAVDVSSAGSTYSHSAMVFYLTLKSYRNTFIKTSLIGGRNVEGQNNAYIDGRLAYGKGFEIKKLQTSGQNTGSFFTTELTLHISSFGVGFSTETVDDIMTQGDSTIQGAAVTSLMLHGVIDNCACFIYSPYRCFEGGTIDASIQVRKNQIADYDEGLIIGDFKDCYINSKIWDYSGKRIIELRTNDSSSNKNIRFGPNTMEYLSSIYDIIQPELLSIASSQGNGTLAGEMGHHDLNAMGAATSYLGYKDYIHTIDNDLLSVDRAVDGVEVDVTYMDPPELEGQSGADIPRSGLNPYFTNSPFDLGGMKFFNLSTGMNLRVEIVFPLNNAFIYRIFNCIIVHLRNKVYNYFNGLTITANIVSEGTTVQEVLFNGSYHDIPTADEQSEVLIPLRQRKSLGSGDTAKPFRFASLVFSFTDYVNKNNIWGNEQFGLFLEGRLNRAVSQPVFTSSGGSLGGNITKKGMPYIFGTAPYSSLSSLPQAADGAIAVVGERPVIKTPTGWMFQQLAATTSELQSLYGCTTGQQAYDTTLKKPVWWNGNDWVDASGNSLQNQ